MTVSQWGRVLVDEIERAEVPSGELWIWPLGGPSLCVRSSEATVYIDPYTGSPNSGPWLRLVAVPFDPADLRHADAVLSTHDHDDHCHEATLRPVIDNTTATLIGPASSARKMLGFGSRKIVLYPLRTAIRDLWRHDRSRSRDSRSQRSHISRLRDYCANGPVSLTPGLDVTAHISRKSAYRCVIRSPVDRCAALSIADLAPSENLHVINDLIQAARDLVCVYLFQSIGTCGETFA